MLYRSEFGLEKRNHIVPLVIGAVSALGSLGVGAYNAYQQSKTNKVNNQLAQQTMQLNQENNALNRDTLEWNKAMSQRDFDYNRQLQERIFQREDSAVQRQVADNRAANLSPIAGIAGASAGQALEANTSELGQLNQNMTAPQMSANQLNIDFSSLSDLGKQIQQYEYNKDALKLKQQQLELEKSSNEANLKDMEQKIEGTKLDNQLKAATMESKIEGAKLSNRKVEKEIAKAGVQILREEIGKDLDDLERIQTKREMLEWLENKGLRASMGEKSLDRLKEEIALKQLQKKIMEGRSDTELKVLKEQLSSLEMKNKSEKEWQETLSDLGFDSGSGKLFGKVFEGLLRLLK